MYSHMKICVFSEHNTQKMCFDDQEIICGGAEGNLKKYEFYYILYLHFMSKIPFKVENKYTHHLLVIRKIKNLLKLL